METKKSIFEVLSAINCNEFIEKKNGLIYLSWANAWGITKKNFPDANYKVKEYQGKPYLFDEDLGYLVTTEVTIQGETMPMSLPVMDNMNRAQKNVVYQLRGKDVQPATMFDINTAIMRCLTKNLAMFGLGHYIYAGEDIPKVVETEESKMEKQKKANELLLNQAKTFTNYDLYKDWYKVNANNVTDEAVKAELAAIGKKLGAKKEEGKV